MSCGSLIRGAVYAVFAGTLVFGSSIQQLQADGADAFAARAEAALAKKSHFSFQETALSDVGEAFAAQLGLPVILDNVALDDVGIWTDTPINKTMTSVSLRSALRLTLKDLQLTYVFRDGAVVITTPEEAETRLVTKFYEVDKLARMRAGTYDPLVVQVPYDFDSIIDIITSSIAPDSWDDVGGPGSIDILGTKMVVSQSNEVHQQIGGMLKSLNTAFDASAKVVPGKPPRVVSYSTEDSATTRKIESSLDSIFSFNFENAMLIDIAELLQDRLSFNVDLDRRSLEDIGIDEETEVDFKADGMTLGNGLRHFLGQMELSFYVSDESLIISTHEEIEYSNRSVRIYPVGDLVFTVEKSLPGYDSMMSVITYSIAPQS